MSENTTNTTNIIVLSGLAICLVMVIVVATAINPIADAALGPLLLGVAAIISAIRGKNNDEDLARHTGIARDGAWPDRYVEVKGAGIPTVVFAAVPGTRSVRNGASGRSW